MGKYVVLMSGIPASGKTCIASRLPGRPISSDVIRSLVGSGEAGDYSDDTIVFDLVALIARHHLSRCRSIVLDMTSPTRELRHIWLELARKHDATAILIHTPCEVDVALRRNAHRKRRLAASWIRESARVYQPPRDTEGFDAMFHLAQGASLDSILHLLTTITAEAPHTSEEW